MGENSNVADYLNENFWDATVLGVFYFFVKNIPLLVTIIISAY